ncbi:MAG TPA: glycosyltransferase family 39 protein [Usitatibacter sp.]|nr:glycosyltransferase family 39 protein [Usitatibacter sp.]
MTARLSRALLALLLAVTVAIGFDNLGRPLANPDEGRYSEISREMAASGDWITPRLNGIKYFEKPPLQYWATAASFSLFGVGEKTARLYVALCGLLTLVLAAYTATRLAGTGAGLGTGLALLSSPYFLALGGIVTLDMGLTLWTTLTLCGYLLAERPRIGPAERRRWMLLAWAGIALAVLSKGLVGIVFPAAALGLLCMLRRDLSPLGRLEWRYGPLLFLAIAAPWFVLVSDANPEFARFFFVHEHFERFLTTAHRRTEPWWYFLPIVVAGFLPWMFALPSALAHAWTTRAEDRGTPPLRFAVLWALFVVAFFSLSGSKLPTYVLPAFPALALVLGGYLAEAPTRKLAWQVLPGVALAAVLGVAAWKFPASGRDEWTRNLYLLAQPLAVAAAIVLAVVSAAAAALLWKGQRWAGLAVVAIGTVLMIDCLEDAYERLSPRQSGQEVAAKAAAAMTPDTRLYSVRIYDQTLPFYLQRPVRLVDYVDEFETGLRSEPALSIPSILEFMVQWLRPGDALAIMHPDIYRSLRSEGLPMQVLHEDPRRILVRKP